MRHHHDQSQPKDDQNSKYTIIDDQNDYKFNRQYTIDNHADVEWKYCYYQKWWSEEVGVVIQFYVVYKSIIYIQLQNYKQLIVFQSLTQSKLTIEMTRTRSDRRRWLALIMINLSFMSSFVLLFIIVIAVVISRSMSILATAMDLVLEILSGIVLFIATRLAAKGIKNGQYQHTLHENDNNVKYIYARRYESLGVLGFSCIMGTCSIGLGGECLIQIVEILKGDYHPVVVFNALPMTIVLVTIFLKIFLLIGCQIAANRNPHNPDSYLAYRDDHRNDILTNTLGFLGATLAYYLKGKWCYCDPIASFILCMYIMFSWGSSAVEQMKQLAGHRTEEKVMDEMMVRLINQMPCSIYITAVEGFIGYSSGQQNVYEIRINVQNNITLAKGHDICQQIQNTFEETLGVERCYVHIETDECINEFE
ncbi:Cation_efflux family protein [Hexamita inflata]|uniref:Cation efflux family protein n=1 Tax=Hexamita inflata TaxID=28002 RepID=A0AA86NQA7_9EUKA|nr:Cation efflux family protein [Hexamita inflata]